MPETNTAKIIRCLESAGWTGRNGGRHDVFTHADMPGVRIVVPRHRTVSLGVARDIAKKAGW